MNKIKSFFKILNYKKIATVLLDAFLLGLILFNLVKLTIATSLLMIGKHCLAVIITSSFAILINFKK